MMKPIPFHFLANIFEKNHASKHLVTGFAIDSRLIKPGDLFFALPGNRVDGGDFLQDAALKGASGAVVMDSFKGNSGDLPLIKVPDVLLALQDLARKSLKERSSKVIAITGSLGKTTTKTFVAALLGTHYHVFASPLSYNSQATLPLSILMAEGNEDYLILEMGMSHPGNLSQLISIAPPEIALITTIAIQHASHFNDGLTGISLEKGSIFSDPTTTLGILHHDITHFQQVVSIGKCAKMTFSLTHQEADYFLEESSQGVLISSKGENPQLLVTNLPNKIHYHNLLAAIVLARRLDIPWASIKEITPSLQLPPMRFERVEQKGMIFINDAYNANPDAMKGALENLPKPAHGGKTIAVLSEMNALGTYCEEGHSLVGKIALLHADHLLCLGEKCEYMKRIWEKEQKPATLFTTRDALGTALQALAQPGDVILLKGARSYALDQLLHLF